MIDRFIAWRTRQVTRSGRRGAWQGNDSVPEDGITASRSKRELSTALGRRSSYTSPLLPRKAVLESTTSQQSLAHNYCIHIARSDCGFSRWLARFTPRRTIESFDCALKSSGAPSQSFTSWIDPLCCGLSRTIRNIRIALPHRSPDGPLSLALYIVGAFPFILEVRSPSRMMMSREIAMSQILVTMIRPLDLNPLLLLPLF